MAKKSMIAKANKKQKFKTSTGLKWQATKNSLIVKGNIKGGIGKQ